jgi:hypothetical protein
MDFAALRVRDGIDVVNICVCLCNKCVWWLLLFAQQIDNAKIVTVRVHRIFMKFGAAEMGRHAR